MYTHAGCNTYAGGKHTPTLRWRTGSFCHRLLTEEQKQWEHSNQILQLSMTKVTQLKLVFRGLFYLCFDLKTSLYWHLLTTQKGRTWVDGICFSFLQPQFLFLMLAAGLASGKVSNEWIFCWKPFSFNLRSCCYSVGTTTPPPRHPHMFHPVEKVDLEVHIVGRCINLDLNYLNLDLDLDLRTLYFPGAPKPSSGKAFGGKLPKGKNGTLEIQLKAYAFYCRSTIFFPRPNQKMWWQWVANN